MMIYFLNNNSSLFTIHKIWLQFNIQWSVIITWIRINSKPFKKWLYNNNNIIISMMITIEYYINRILNKFNTDIIIIRL